ncbi:peptide/nickel transport system substrate-binding protein [Butyrivibrio sp. INlla18]|uniref:peptide ABC transporter substrate-binding protein n=1 Tax=Butyrivibrio sp. INlla18 TaxID=1520806 RepID=UPI00087EFA0E|nr:ABC transporter substrate-binding protein [Butyrivibrio sp. INlla18]SDA57571.1 peptide/nickel transport system substrate-binding protein [Butyrivibrio sp. INlla18]
MMKRKLKASALFMVMVLLLTGCYAKLPDIENHELDDAYRSDATVYNTLYSSEVTNLNYLVTSSPVDTVITANVIDALVDYDNEGNIIPGLAESWECTEDMTTWIFHLRDGIKWVDYEGKVYGEVVADDWVAAAEYVNNAANETDCQYMYCTGSVVTGAQEYYDYTRSLLHPEEYDVMPKKVEASEIGVEAHDDKTLIYKLDKPCPFFLSVLSYTSYLPVNRKYLKAAGTMFGKDYKNVLYNGAYILHYFQPLEKQILVKNPHYWDKDKVYIDRVENAYDSEAATIGVERYEAGLIDKAVVSADKLEHYLTLRFHADEIHGTIPDCSYSYFYVFNFDPNYDEENEPDNWRKAVVNENFRKAIMSSIDREEVLSVYEPYDPGKLINNTVTPPGAISIDGKDYTKFGKLSYYSGRDSYNKNDARIYRDLAKRQLKEAGVTFPIKILMPYNPSVVGWKQEVFTIKKQLEHSLGSDFIEVVVEAGSDTGFLNAVQRSGKFSFMKCRWGADYEDPQTWTEPFEEEDDYSFWHQCEDEKVKEVCEIWEKQKDNASEITDNENLRFEAFAEAERLILDHAIVVPFSIMIGDGYVMDKINEFEREYSSYGMAKQRYKGCHLYEDSMDMEEYQKAYKEWAHIEDEEE